MLRLRKLELDIVINFLLGFYEKFVGLRTGLLILCGG